MERSNARLFDCCDSGVVQNMSLVIICMILQIQIARNMHRVPTASSSTFLQTPGRQADAAEWFMHRPQPE
jgi:hypothetical protein